MEMSGTRCILQSINDIISKKDSITCCGWTPPNNKSRRGSSEQFTVASNIT